MLKKTLLTLSILFALVLFGCSKTETTNREVTPSTNRAGATSTPAAAAGEKIGVPECDEFIAAYEACISNKVPAESRAQFNSSVAAWRKSWRSLANDARSKPTLVQVCKSSMEQARTSMKVYGCTF